MAMSLRERVKSSNSLICLLQGIQGYRTIVELRREDTVCGILNHVDGFMSLDMSNCIYTAADGRTQKFDKFFVHGGNIRFVHIPDEVNMVQTIHQQMEDFYGKRVSSARRGNRVRRKHDKKEQRQLRKQVLLKKIEETKRLLGIKDKHPQHMTDQAKDSKIQNTTEQTNVKQNTTEESHHGSTADACSSEGNDM